MVSNSIPPPQSMESVASLTAPRSHSSLWPGQSPGVISLLRCLTTGDLGPNVFHQAKQMVGIAR